MNKGNLRPSQILYPELLVVFIAIRFAVTEHWNQNLCRPINQRNHRCFGSLTIICSIIVYCIQKQLCLHSTIRCWWLHPCNVFFTSSSIKGMKERYGTGITCVPDMQILLYIEKQLNVRESKDHVLVTIYPFVDGSPKNANGQLYFPGLVLYPKEPREAFTHEGILFSFG